MTLSPTLSVAELADDLRRHITGRVVGSDEPDADSAAAGFNTATRHSPDLVVLAANADDVATAVRIAAAGGRRVAVQATGHGAPATGPGTLLIRTGALDEVSVDPAARTATIGAGATWQQVLDTAAPHGLAPLAGSAPSVGAVGYTLGGGLGPVARTFGFAADHVRRLTVVTADGDLVDVDAASDPERFWALRGGGAAFGLVTSMTIDLFPLSHLYAGGLWFTAEVARTVLHRWREWTAGLPETVSTSVARLDLPPSPALPEPLRGRSVVHVRIACVTTTEEGERLVAPLRAAATPLLDTVGALPYAALGAIHADPVDPQPFHERSALLADLPPEAVDALLAAAGAGSGSPLIMAEIRQLGGAVARPGVYPSAYSHRDARFSLLCIGVAAPPVVDATVAYAAAVLKALQPWSTGGLLPNFGGGGTAAYSADDLARLRSLMGTYDPARLLTAGDALR